MSINNLINTIIVMTLKKYFYALISVLLISAPISAQQKADQMTKRAKYYVFQQKDKIGKMDKVLNLKLSKMHATDRTIKIVYTKGNTNFVSLYPEMTEGKFKTEAQENRYVARNYCIWKVATDALASPSFASVIRNDVYTWLVDVVGPEGGEPLYSFDFKTQAVRNAIILCGGKMPADFKNYLSKTIVERALPPASNRLQCPFFFSDLMRYESNFASNSRPFANERPIRTNGPMPCASFATARRIPDIFS